MRPWDELKSRMFFQKVELTIIFILIVVSIIVVFVVIIIVIFFNLRKFMQGSKMVLVRVNLSPNSPKSRKTSTYFSVSGGP